jgi:hypothetical protein
MIHWINRCFAKWCKVERANARSRVAGRGSLVVGRRSGLDRELGLSGVPKGALGVSNAAWWRGGAVVRCAVCGVWVCG